MSREELRTIYSERIEHFGEAILRETGIKPADNRSYVQAAIVMRGFGKGRKRLKIIGPKNTKIMASRPLFSWRGPEKGLQYRFVLTDDAGSTLIETLVNGAGFRLPDEIRLAGGAWYTWRIEARLSSGKVYSATADFNLLEKSERDRLNRLRPSESSPFAQRVLYATVLEQMGLLDQARRHWQALAAERPDVAALKAKAKR